MSPEQIAAIIATAQKPREARIRSRLYGFRIIKNQPVQVIESEAAIIRQVFGVLVASSTLTASEILGGLAENLKRDGIRNRSRQCFSVARLRGLVKAIYAGIETHSSGWFRVSNYPKIIVSEGIYWAAVRRLSK